VRQVPLLHVHRYRAAVAGAVAGGRRGDAQPLPVPRPELDLLQEVESDRGVVQPRAAAIAAKPRSRSAIRSETSSSPMCRRIAGPPGAQVVAVRKLDTSNGIARLS